VLHIDVAKVDQDIAYVAMVVYVCCKLLFPMFYLFFHTYVASVFYLDVAYVSHVCCKCFIRMLHTVCNDFQVFLQMFQMHVSSVSSVFRRILQVLHLNASKVDRVLHMLQCDPPAAGPCCC
jgi:hypothetical protein